MAVNNSAHWLRVGAVAAGIGTALVTGHGVAIADDTGTTTDSSSTGTTTSTGTSDSEPADAEQDSQTDDEGEAEEAEEAEEADEAEETDEAEEVEEDTDSRRAPRREVLRVAELSDQVSEVSEQAVAVTQAISTPEPEPETESGNPAAFTVAAAVPALPPQATVSVVSVSPPRVTAWRPAREFVIGVLETAGFDPNPAPGAPPNSPVLEAIWAVYRRIEAVFANEGPNVVGATVTDSQIVDGAVEVTGVVEFDDLNDDPLTYTATNGEHGTVVVGADGTFTYTPTDPNFTGTDTFSITASDNGFHSHGLPALQQSGDPHTSTALVSITLTEAANQPPVLSNHSAGEPDENGVVTGTFTVTDLNGDDVDIAAPDTVDIVVTQDPTTPTVHTVTYTYTPSFDDRLAASYAGSGSETLTFTASDGEFDSDPLSVAVDVRPFDANTVIATVGGTPGGSEIVLSTDGSTAYVAGSGSTVKVIDTATFTVVDTVDVGAPVNGLALADNDTRLYATHADAGTISVIDTTTNAVIETFDVDGTPLHIAVSPDGDTVYAPYGGGVWVIDASDHTIIDDIPITTTSSFFRNIAVSPDGETLYVTGGDGITVIDTSTGAVTTTIATAGFVPSDIAVSPDGETLYVTTNFFGSVRGIDVATGNVVGVRYYSGLELGLSPDGSAVYATDFTGNGVYVINTTDYEIDDSITVGDSPQGVVFSPDGALAYVANASTGTVSVIWTGLVPE